MGVILPAWRANDVGYRPWKAIKGALPPFFQDNKLERRNLVLALRSLVVELGECGVGSWVTARLGREDSRRVSNPSLALYPLWGK